MIRKLFNYNFYNNLDGGPLVREDRLSHLKIHKNIYKSSSLPAIYILGFVEFGCEAFFPYYVLPNIIKENPNYKIVFVGWCGREYFYKHLVHEYWELDESFMHLRQTARAMSYESWNLKQLETYFSRIGIVLRSDVIGNNLIEYMCLDCGHKSGYARHLKGCPVCGSNKIRQSLLSNQSDLNKKLYPLPEIKESKLDWAKSIIPKNAVAIFARKREAYGRNLNSDFYKRLIFLLKKMGYTPVWIGEKNSSLACPDSSVLDITSLSDRNDLEKVLAIISLCEFTIQLWTASTRLSMIANTKFFLVECPDQIYGNGQEGIRLKIFNLKNTPSKLFLCNYCKFVEDYDKTFNCLEKSLNEFLIEQNYNDTIDMIDNKKLLEGLKVKNAFR